MRKSSRIARFLTAEGVLLGLVAASPFVASGVSAQSTNDPFGQVKTTDEDENDNDNSWSAKIGDTVKNTFTNAGKTVGLGGKPDAPPPPESPSGCPTIAILEGTASSRVMAAGASGNQGVRYQFSLGQVGRQCTISGGRISIKVAASGRALLGPAGTAGQFDVPVRVVVFSEAQQKPVASKLFKVSASLGNGRATTPFQLVSDDIVVPTSGRPAAEYSIKVGLDSGKGGGPAVASGKGRRHRQKEASR